MAYGIGSLTNQPLWTCQHNTGGTRKLQCLRTSTKGAKMPVNIAGFVRQAELGTSNFEPGTLGAGRYLF